MTRPSRYPVSSFGPELLALLIKGSQEEVTVRVDDAKTLMFLQNRIHMLRGSMGREKHPSYQLVQRARTSRMWDEPDGKRTKKPTKDAKNFRLVVKPNDNQFAKYIIEAGVTIDEEAVRGVLDEVETPATPSDPSTAPSTEPSTSGDPYASFKE